MDESSNNREDLSEVSNALQDQIEAQLLLGFDETASEDELRKIMADMYEDWGEYQIEKTFEFRNAG